MKAYSLISKAIFAILLMSGLLLPQTVQAATTKQISQFGITWNFDKEYEYGQFANGDYWVVGPAKVVKITPESFIGDGIRTQDGETWVVQSGRIINGAMIIRDLATRHGQGFDSVYTEVAYNETSNVARKNNQPIDDNNTLELLVGDSLISSISLTHTHADFGGRHDKSCLRTAAVLTVLGSPAPEGSFRPPFIGIDKTIKFNANQLNSNILKSLDRKNIVNSTSLKMQNWTDTLTSSTERMVDRPWIQIGVHVGGEGLSPIENMNRYPNYRYNSLQPVAVLLNLDWGGSPGFITNEEYKKDTLVGIVQIGIDDYAFYQAGLKEYWKSNGGHGNSAKWPILLAGVMLDGPGAHSDAQAMAKIGFNPRTDIKFGEDDQTFYVSQRNIDAHHAIYADSYAGSRGWADPGSIPYPPGTGGACSSSKNISACLNACGPDSRERYDSAYTETDIGLPEWGIRNADLAYQSNRVWETYYRKCCTASYWSGVALSMQIMGLRDEWNHSAFFDYMDRYNQVETYIRATAIAQGKTALTRTVIEPPLEFNIPGTPATDVHGKIINETHGNWSLYNSKIVEQLWNAYRDSFGCTWKYDNIADKNSKWHYDCAGEKVQCNTITTCSDYPNSRAREYDPCRIGCAVQNIIYGDANNSGKVTIEDAALAAKIVVKLVNNPDARTLAAADVDGNGVINIQDAALIAKKVVGLITRFPVEAR